MLSILSNGQDRPSRLEKSKNEQYHLDFARYCTTDANNALHTKYLEKIALNKKFYIGDQWVNTEDTELFFKDDTGQERNRIKIIQNLIRPMVEQYRGNAIRMSINAKVKSMSPKAINRREKQLARLKFFTRIAQKSPFGDTLKQRMPIGDTEAETEQIFENIWIDKYVTKMNYLLKYVSELNKFQDHQVRIAEEMALAGIAVEETFEWSGNQRFEIVPSEEFFWDRSAKKYDLTDSEYMGKCRYMLPSEIFEQFPDIKDWQKESVEKYARQYRKTAQEQGLAVSGARIPVFFTYWKDSEEFEYGYVKDPFGYPYLTKINHKEEGEEQPRYTDKDLIQVNSERSRRVLKGNLKTRFCPDTLRYCIFIPNEVTNTTDEAEKKGDIVLDFGMVPYQETDNLDLNNVQFPFKAYCWGYINGEVMSPVDDAINPQRFINRIMSVAENQINNSRGSGTVYDETAIGKDGEDTMLRNMNQSKPVGINAKGRGIQNVVGSYDSTVKQGTMVMFNIVDTMKQFIQSTTGVNEALKGESMGSDQLVGVTQLMIQRGSLLQEPFYNAITQIFMQCFQSIASVGKRIYADNERELAIATGDEGLEIITISKDMKLEDYRCFVKRENIDEVLINAGNTMLMQLVQLQMLDQIRFANLYGRSTPDDVARALRESGKEKIELKRMEGKKDQEEMAMMQQAEQEQQGVQQQQLQQMMQREDMKDAQNKSHEIDTIFAKSVAKGMENKQMAAQEKNNLQNNFANSNL